jgi:hypothetical protein
MCGMDDASIIRVLFRKQDGTIAADVFNYCGFVDENDEYSEKYIEIVNGCSTTDVFRFLPSTDENDANIHWDDLVNILHDLVGMIDLVGRPDF